MRLKSQWRISTGHYKRSYISGLKDKEHWPIVSTNQELQNKCRFISLIPRNKVPLVKITVAQLVKTCPTMHPTVRQTRSPQPCKSTIHFSNRSVLHSRGAYGREEKWIQGLVGQYERKTRLWRPGMVGTILKCILHKYNTMVWTGFIWLRTGANSRVLWTR